MQYLGHVRFIAMGVLVLAVAIAWMMRLFVGNQANANGPSRDSCPQVFSIHLTQMNRTMTIHADACRWFSHHRAPTQHAKAAASIEKDPNKRKLNQDNHYVQARDSFRKLVRKLQQQQKQKQQSSGGSIELHSLSVIPDTEYTMDIAVLPGDRTVGDDGAGLVVHISGTHGVEGHAGSAIQRAYLQSLLDQPRALVDSDWRQPTLILVHAMNPYGMAHDRRVNEENVDLNRNGLTDLQWDRVRTIGHGNQDLFDRFDTALFNPNMAGWLPSWYVAYVHTVAKTIWAVLRIGAPLLKEAMVGGQYHKPSGIFFGGQKRQRSVVVLQDFLKRYLDGGHLTRTSITWIDVHTGLGSFGRDTLLPSTKTTSTPDDKDYFVNEGAKWFPGALLPYSPPPTDGTSQTREMHTKAGEKVLQGYNATIGLLVDYYYQQFFELAPHALFLAQEFGTMPTVMVGHALIVENAAHQQLSTVKSTDWSRRLLRPVFDPDITAWQISIVQRGLTVLWQAMERSSVLSVPFVLADSDIVIGSDHAKSSTDPGSNEATKESVIHHEEGISISPNEQE